MQTAPHIQQAQHGLEHFRTERRKAVEAVNEALNRDADRGELGELLSYMAWLQEHCRLYADILADEAAPADDPEAADPWVTL